MRKPVKKIDALSIPYIWWIDEGRDYPHLWWEFEPKMN